MSDDARLVLVDEVLLDRGQGLKPAKQRGKYRKGFLAPKTRLLLEIELRGVRDSPDWLARLTKRVGYSSEGHLRPDLDDLLQRGMISSTNMQDPPFKITAEGRDFLMPLLLVRRMAYVMAFTTIYELADLVLFGLSTLWARTMLILALIYALLLLIYPELILRLGKIPYRKNN